MAALVSCSQRDNQCGEMRTHHYHYYYYYYYYFGNCELSDEHSGMCDVRCVRLMKMKVAPISYHVICILMSEYLIMFDVFISKARLVTGMPMIKPELWCINVLFTEFMISTTKLSLSLSLYFITSCTEKS